MRRIVTNLVISLGCKISLTYAIYSMYCVFQGYSGFLQVKIDKYLHGYDDLLYMLGYEKIGTDYELKAKVSIDKKTELAFDCHMAYQELQIYVFLLQNVEGLGCKLEHVDKCRKEHPSDINDSVQWITDKFGPKDVKIEPDYITVPTRGFITADSENLPKSTPSPLPVTPNTGYHHFSEYDPGTPQTVSRNSTANKDSIGKYHEHLAAESLRVRLEQEVGQNARPKAPVAETTTDWKDVNQFKTRLGQSYTDPGGRGDILQGQKSHSQTKYSRGVKAEDPATRSNNIPTPYVEISSKHPDDKALFKPVAPTADKRLQQGKKSRLTPSELQWQSPTGQPDMDFHSLLEPMPRKSNQPHMTSFGREVQLPEEISRSPSISSQDRFILESDPRQQHQIRDVASHFYSSASAFQSLPPESTQYDKHYTKENRAPARKIGHLGRTIHDSDEEEANKVWQCSKCTFANSFADRVCATCGSSADGGDKTVLKSNSPSCPRCTLVNERGAKTCASCATPLGGSTFV